MSIKIYKVKSALLNKDMKLHHDIAITTDNGKITKIEDANKVKQTKDVCDLKDTVLVPGLIDCHSHLALDTRINNHLEKMNDNECEQTIRALKTMKDDLLSGVTL